MPIIKAGTYTFIETPSFEGISFTTSSGENGMYIIPVRCTFPFTNNGVDYEVTASTLYLWNHTASDYPDEQHYQILGDVESVTPANDEIALVQLYDSSPNVLWRSGSRTITVLEDTEITNTVASNWFEDNTEPVEEEVPEIPEEPEEPETYTLKGIWKFNETVELKNIEQDIEFLNPAFQSFDSSKPEAYIRITVSTSDIVYTQRCYDIAGEFSNTYTVYNDTSWGTDDNRRVDIQGEIEVSKEFYEWFTANAVDISDRCTRVSYGGRCIAVLEAGGRVTLPCKDLLMATDVTITAPIDFASEDVADSSLPIQIANADEMTALLDTAEVGSVYKYIGETGTYEYGGLYVVEAVSE